MRSGFWNKRIPSLLGIIFLVGSAFFTAYFVQNQIVLFSQAAPTNVPSHITMTNISDVSFTVVYSTSQSTTGSVILGTDPTKTDKLVLDDRDQATGNPQNYFVHHITVKNTKPDTTYSFFILSGTDVFGKDSNKTPFVLKTGKTVSDSPSSQPPLSGKVKKDGTQPLDAAVILTPENGAPVSTLIKSDGTYFLPLNALRDSSTQSYLAITPQTKLSFFFLGSSSSSHVSALTSQTDPLPLVTLGQDYDFTTLPPDTTTPNTSASPSAQTSTDQSNLPSFAEASKNPIVSVIVPENGTPDDQPLLQGTGVPQETVSIEIHSDQVINDSVKVGSNGQWTYRPSTSLTPGVHTITIKSKNSKGILQTITQSFTVYAEGSQSTEPSVKPTAIPTATPSPTPTISLTASVSPTPTLALPTNTPTPSPTKSLIPTPTPTVPLPSSSTSTSSGTIISSPPSAQPNNNGTLASTGSMSALVALGGGLATIVSGLLLFTAPTRRRK
jgi:hypothetical protein